MASTALCEVHREEFDPPFGVPRIIAQTISTPNILHMEDTLRRIGHSPRAGATARKERGRYSR